MAAAEAIQEPRCMAQAVQWDAIITKQLVLQVADMFRNMEETLMQIFNPRVLLCCV